VRTGEADVFHTRQQHTLKVAQVGRRLAQVCIGATPALAAEIGLDADVVEAACLAHDLGHPPFGHIGEKALNALVNGEGAADGFEGNAQSFRIVTKLAVRFDDCPGLDLTRATLGAILKYPWLRDPSDPKRTGKWGVYASEQDDFDFAFGNLQERRKTAEAELMDFADDISYSVHDLEDSHRVGVLPWHRILGDDDERLVQRAKESWFDAPNDSAGRLRTALRNLRDFLQGTYSHLLETPYEGARVQRLQLRSMTSQLIFRFIHAAKLNPASSGPTVLIDDDISDEIKILKQIIRDYVISNPSLVGQQRGQKRIIDMLFTNIRVNTKSEYPDFLPTRLRYLWDASDHDPVRFSADCVASLTEAEAVGLFNRLMGHVAGSVLDPIVR
jgi:dGTPase